MPSKWSCVTFDVISIGRRSTGTAFDSVPSGHHVVDEDVGGLTCIA
jgi:hypothetical protein